MSEIDHGTWDVDGLAFSLSFVGLAVLSLLLPFLLRDAVYWRWSGRRISRRQRQDPDVELVGIVAHGREGCLAAAFAGLWARGLVPAPTGRPATLDTPGLSALQLAILAEAAADQLPGPVPGSPVAAAIRNVEKRARRAGLVRSLRSWRTVQIGRFAIPAAVVCLGFVLMIIGVEAGHRPVAVAFTSVFLAVFTIAMSVFCEVGRVTGRGGAVVRELKVLQDAGPSADGPGWLRDRTRTTALACALSGFYGLRTRDPWFNGQLPDPREPRLRVWFRGGSSSGTSTGGGGHGCGSSCGGGGGCGGG